MKNKSINRRQFIGTTATGAIGAVALGSIPYLGKTTNVAAKLAILGGTPIRGKGDIGAAWPYVDEKMVEAISKTTRSGIWCRIQSPTGTVPTFEQEYAKLMDAKFSVAVGSGTQALHTCVEALGIGPGDEVITTPYTDMGTISGILSARALPVMADLDPESFQLDPEDVERRITKNTKAIIAVHIMGQPCDLDRIMAIAKKYNLIVIEDACQAHLGEFRGKKLGTIGDVGCFSFQTSKTISCGEGGAIIGNNKELMDRCYTVQNHGTDRKGHSVTIGPKYRMNEFEGAILLGQLEGAKDRFALRNKNAAYLSSKLKNFPGLVPQKLYEGTDSGSFYLYAMSYHKEHFNNASRDTFLKALRAEGVDMNGYIKNGLHREPWVDHILNLKVYQKMYSPARLKEYREQLACPKCDQVCEQMVMLWASGPLLGTQADMDDIINAIMKVHANRDQLNQI